jgi:hypothetical protein
VHERGWPAALVYVSMSCERERGARLPLGAGQHLVVFGATGAGGSPGGCDGPLAAAVGTPDGVSTRRRAIKQSDPYYDVLCRHLDIVCRVLHAAGRWPASIPMLVGGSGLSGPPAGWGQSSAR